MATAVNARDTAPALSAQLVSVGATVYPAGRALRIDCTTGGSITYTIGDGSTIILHPQANTIYDYNDSVVGVPAVGGGYVGAIYILY